MNSRLWRWCVGIFVTMAILVLTPALVGPVSAGEWVSTTVDSEGDVGYDSAMVVDASNRYLIAYDDYTNGALKFAISEDNGRSWQTSVVDSDEVEFISITADPASNAYLISYYGNGRKDLRFAKSDDLGESWEITTVATGINGCESMIIVDREGSYVILYMFKGEWELMLATSADGGETWVCTPIEDVSMVGDYYKELLVNQDNKYIAVYSDFGHENVVFATSDNGGFIWEKSFVASELATYTGVSVAKEARKYLIVTAKRDAGEITLFTSVDDGSTWELTDTFLVEEEPYYPRVFIDGNTYLVLYDLYFSEGIRGVKLLISDDNGATWTESTIADNASMVHGVTLDRDGNLAVSYQSSTDGSLMFSRFDSQAPHISTASVITEQGSPQFSLVGAITDEFGTVSSVEYQVDCPGGVCDASAWTACSAEDGVFDEAEEGYICQVTEPLSAGPHSIYIRATDSYGNTTLSGSEVSVEFEVAASVEDPEEPASEGEETGEPVGELAQTGGNLILPCVGFAGVCFGLTSRTRKAYSAQAMRLIE